MKKSPIKFIIAALSLLFIQNANAQKPQNWTSEQLMEPAVLAETIQSGKNIPIIYSVGPGDNIPNTVVIGTGNDEKNIGKFKKEISTLPKDKKLVIYCGCCPFEHCPNVRPAIAVLKEAKFTNYYLLNLPTNLKKDWVDKGYPSKKNSQYAASSKNNE